MRGRAAMAACAGEGAHLGPLGGRRARAPVAPRVPGRAACPRPPPAPHLVRLEPGCLHGGVVGGVVLLRGGTQLVDRQVGRRELAGQQEGPAAAAENLLEEAHVLGQPLLAVLHDVRLRL
jgi:hypothetical protein